MICGLRPTPNGSIDFTFCRFAREQTKELYLGNGLDTNVKSCRPENKTRPCGQVCRSRSFQTKEFEYARPNDSERAPAGARRNRHGPLDDLATHRRNGRCIRRKPGITWEQVEGAITGQTGYVSTRLQNVYDDDNRVIAVYDGKADDVEDDGFVLGEAGDDRKDVISGST